MVFVLIAPWCAFAENLFFAADMEQIEHRFKTGGADAFATEGGASLGADRWKLGGHFEGEYSHGENIWESAELQARFSAPVSVFADAYAGFRHDVRPVPARSYFMAGVSGLAPYFIETDAGMFVSEKGNISVRLEAETDLLITQRLVLQLSAEANAAFGDDERIGVGAGLASTETGLRLRYEIVRDIAPYVGINHERKWEKTRRLAAKNDEERDSFSLLVGLKLSY